MTPTATTVSALAALQWLHALSFGATHLAAIQFIQREVPNRCSATAQSLTAAVSTGLFMAPATMLAGELFASSGGAAFYAMTGVAAAGGVCGIALARMRS
ncbi:MAG: hypothetical protein GY944_25920 [bacterium]|nr:hypothetical protein [bacterium]